MIKIIDDHYHGESLTFEIEVVGTSPTPTQEPMDCPSGCDCSGGCHK